MNTLILYTGVLIILIYLQWYICRHNFIYFVFSQPEQNDKNIHELFYAAEQLTRT